MNLIYPTRGEWYNVCCHSDDQLARQYIDPVKDRKTKGAVTHSTVQVKFIKHYRTINATSLRSLCVEKSYFVKLVYDRSFIQFLPTRPVWAGFYRIPLSIITDVKRLWPRGQGIVVIWHLISERLPLGNIVIQAKSQFRPRIFGSSSLFGLLSLNGHVLHLTYMGQTNPIFTLNSNDSLC